MIKKRLMWIGWVGAMRETAAGRQRAPDAALDEDLVLPFGNQRSKTSW